jgi:hypothetical protein
VCYPADVMVNTRCYNSDDNYKQNAVAQVHDKHVQQQKSTGIQLPALFFRHAAVHTMLTLLQQATAITGPC